MFGANLQPFSAFYGVWVTVCGASQLIKITITALESYDSKAVTYMIRGKMMSIVILGGLSPTDLQIYYNAFEKKSKRFEKFFLKKYFL